MFLRKVAPGVEFRLFEEADANPLFEVVDRNRAQLRQWLPWVDFTTSPEDLLRFIGRVRDQYDSDRGPQCAIKVDGAIAGSIGCHPYDWPNRACSIGYWIDPRFTGRGIVTRCCEVMLDYLFGEAGMHRVVIQCGTENTRSCAIPKRLGFTREGVARHGERVNDRWLDLNVWSVLEDEWRELRK
jgi:ribosomal-protein-serine acetyltransferase